MKICLVSYFYPPVNAVAAERWGRFAAALRDCGHEVQVITGPWGKEGSKEDTHFLTDPVSEDARRLTSTGPLAKVSAFRKFIRAAKISFLLIDGKWLWSLKAAKKLWELATQEEFSAVIVTGSPWSSLPVTALVCSLKGVPLAIDCRDPWSGEETYRYKGRFARAYIRTLESWTVRKASLLISVSQALLDRFAKWAPGVPTLVLESGFSGQIDWTPESFNSTRGKKFALLYSGTVTDYHGMHPFLEAADEALPKGFQIDLVGTDHTAQVKKYDFCIQHRPVSAHEAENMIKDAAAVLMTLSAERGGFSISGKLMTYLKCGRPILYFGPVNSPAADLIRDYGLGWIVDGSKPENLAKVLKEIQNHYTKQTTFKLGPKAELLNQYSAENMVSKLEAALSRAIARPNLSHAAHDQA